MSMKVFIMNNFSMRTVKTRKGDFVPMWCASAISEDGKVVSVASFEEQRVVRFGKGDYLSLRNFKEMKLEDQTISITLSAQSTVFKTSKFPVDQSLIDQFGTVPLVTVKEALTSPKKRRISIEGTVDEVYPVRDGAGWRRRDIRISSGSDRITVKLWDHHTEKDVAAGDKVTCVNVTVNEYQGKTELNTTAQSNIEVKKTEMLDVELTIDGVDDTGATVGLLDTKGEVYTVDRDLIVNIYGTVESFEEGLPKRLVASLIGKKINKLQKIG